ncbi:hypothetical protein C2E20_2710 [Micractinium conductrix]|uniref:Uncharacterized protein n=1 Tax=Micractinium conductrix TaxID=554055 RepID=A0A2P6VIQ5_9CHLO|nr:hypothetical protein C2E20_2710 [Micractinium conductrix]|eukprot:PSC73981.1 hypothetical protein C2E20_2710 [Micractinium conductrix]
MDTSYRTMEALAPACCAPPSPDRSSPEASAAFAPRATPAPDAPAACSGISDGQLLALTDTASLTADQLDRRHHLLRHSLPDEVRGEGALLHFEAASVAEAVKLIKKMSQRDLQAKFKLVYGAKTFSNNNNWLRRKLFEAIGADPAKGAVKKAAAAGGARRRRGAAPAARRAPAKKVQCAPRGGWHVAASAWDEYPGQYEQTPAAAAAYGDRSHPPPASYFYAEAEAMSDDEDHSHVCEALLALGDAAAAAATDDCASEGSVPSVALTAAGERTPASDEADAALEAAIRAEEEHEAQAAGAGGSAAFRRLLVEQHQAAQAAAAAAGAGLAEWMASVTAAAVGAGASQEEAAALAAQMRAAAAAQMHPMLAASLGLLPAWPHAYGMYAPAGMHGMAVPYGAALHHLAAGHAAVPPLFAAAK